MNKKGSKGILFLGIFVLISSFALVFFLNLGNYTGNVVLESECISNLTNSTPTNWENQTSCFANSTLIQNRSFIEYDLNNCTANSTHWNFQEANCTFVCVTVLVNDSWSDWEIQDNCTDNLQLKNRSKIQYDSNKCNLSLENQTFWDYKNVSCISCSSSFVNISSVWRNVSICQNGLMLQIMNITQYDSSNCTRTNSTFYFYQNISCPIINNTPVQQPNLSLVVPIQNVSTKSLTANQSSLNSSNSSSSQTIFLIVLVILILLFFIGGIIALFIFNKKENTNPPQPVSYNSAMPYTPS